MNNNRFILSPRYIYVIYILHLRGSINDNRRNIQLNRFGIRFTSFYDYRQIIGALATSCSCFFVPTSQSECCE
jgi:hypothetical protein